MSTNMTIMIGKTLHIQPANPAEHPKTPSPPRPPSFVVHPPRRPSTPGRHTEVAGALTHGFSRRERRSRGWRLSIPALFLAVADAPAASSTSRCSCSAVSSSAPEGRRRRVNFQPARCRGEIYPRPAARSLGRSRPAGLGAKAPSNPRRGPRIKIKRRNQSESARGTESR